MKRNFNFNLFVTKTLFFDFNNCIKFMPEQNIGRQ